MTTIEWTDRTWNPVTGCTRISDGCTNCYIERTPPLRMAGRRFSGPDTGATLPVQLHPERLRQPLSWRKPQRVFVCSMADLFHDDVPTEHLAQVWAAMAATPRHTFQVLTKRPARMRKLMNADYFRMDVNGEYFALDLPAETRPYDIGVRWPLPNVWLGVSAENQKWADTRIPILLDTPAEVRFVSAEPLLGPLDIAQYLEPLEDPSACGDEDHCSPWARSECLDWVIVGGESGPRARPMHPDWARSLRDQCTEAVVGFHFKQWGEWGPAPWRFDRNPGETDEQYIARSEAEAATHSLPPWANEYDMQPMKAHPAWGGERGPLAPNEPHAPLRRWGKKRAGRELDGRTWDQFPDSAGGG